MPIFWFISGIISCDIQESNGFLKYVCDDGNLNHILYKCHNSEEFYRHFLRNSQPYFEGDPCSNDPYFYQACNKQLSPRVTNDELLCKNYLCNPSPGTTSPRFSGKLFTGIDLARLGSLKCRPNFSCTNTDLEKEGCNSRTVVMLSGKTASAEVICNRVCDDDDPDSCEDEAVCNGYRYGMYCTGTDSSGRLTYVPPIRICDGVSDCRGHEDEADCVTDKTETSCRHVSTGHLVPVHNYTRCTYLARSDFIGGRGRSNGVGDQGPQSDSRQDSSGYCGLRDLVKQQSNCSDSTRVGLSCKIDGYMSNISRFLICSRGRVRACDDGIDRECFEAKSCRIHKHLMCDKKPQCSNGFDESHRNCTAMTTATCRRRFENQIELAIPISWLKDGVWDCENGIDETADWPTCGQAQSGTLRYQSSDETKCENVFLCRFGSLGYVELAHLCDGIDTCGNENGVCSISSLTDNLPTTVFTTDSGRSKHLSFCLKGLETLQQLKADCVTENFRFPDEDVFGVDTKTSVMLPDEEQVCDNMFGELYLYTSCTGRCHAAQCPLRNIPRYEMCPDQFPKRVGTIANNKYLVFLTKPYEGVYSNSYFVCNNRLKCIDYSQVCNLVDDCGDRSDERNCTNHFKCLSSEKLIPKTQVCDGNIECSDLSDECNEQCSRQILRGNFLKGLSWLIGFLAILANLVIITKSLQTLKRCRTSVALVNRLLILAIAIGDLFIGCYLLVVAIYDRITLGSYCPQQISWISSLHCSAIGIFSTIGSQISLFSMTGLSIVRMHGIWQSMRIPKEVTSGAILRISLALLLFLSVSVSIAIIPIFASFEDFFVNGIKFADELKIFKGPSGKETIFAVIEAYYGRAKDTTLKWKRLIQMVADMFSRDLDYQDHTQSVKKVGFYGNDGVCLFKYFVNDDDPQRIFVWSILALNFFCFVLISISYLVIGIKSQKSSKSLRTSQNNKHLDQRNKRMNQRIAFIITTDFLCWVPFIVICVLHSTLMIDATQWYGMFSMVILPINSVINPLLYDEVVTKAIRTPILALSRTISRSSLFQSARGRIHPAQNLTCAVELEERAEGQDSGNVNVLETSRLQSEIEKRS